MVSAVVLEWSLYQEKDMAPTTDINFQKVFSVSFSNSFQLRREEQHLITASHAYGMYDRLYLQYAE